MTYAPPPPPPPPGYPPQPPPGYAAAPPPGYPATPPGGTVYMPHLVQLTIGHQDKYSRGMGCLGALFFLGRYIALIPVFIWLGILGLVVSIVAWIMEIVVVLSGHYPQGPHSFVTGFLRLTVKTYAWMFGLVDKYPGYSTKP
jgi:hypothetical protein